MSTPILIILAGGKSTRMGVPKGLLNYHGTPWILEQILRYKDVDQSRVYIGLGYDYEQYYKQIPWFVNARANVYNFNTIKVRVFINKYPEMGSFSTLQTVLHKIDHKSDVLVLPIDVPLLDLNNLQLLIAEENMIVIPNCNTKNGHPVKLNYTFWKTLLQLDLVSENTRLDTQIKQRDLSSITYLNVSDTSVYQNINSFIEWQKYIDINT